MTKRWLLERYGPPGLPPVVDECFGDDGYLKLGTHQDAIEPGRVKAVALDGDGPRVMLELDRNETLVVSHRRTRTSGPDGRPVPAWIVLGARKADGTGRYLFVGPDGSVLCSTNLNAL